MDLFFGVENGYKTTRNIRMKIKKGPLLSKIALKAFNNARIVTSCPPCSENLQKMLTACVTPTRDTAPYPVERPS